LQDLGLTKGDRFALCLPNTPYFIVLYFAALKVGAVMVHMNPLYTEREMEHIIRDSGARMAAVVDVASIHGKLRSVAAACGIGTIIMCPMADILPTIKSLGWRVLKRGSMPISAMMTGCMSITPACWKAGNPMRRWRFCPAILPCCNTPGAPRARPRGRC
jgi:acyl-CoA synthetase (AMP-forming)/AMP-acid ligase II